MDKKGKIKKDKAVKVFIILAAITFLFVLVVSTASSRKLLVLKHFVYNDSTFYSTNRIILQNHNLFELAKIRSKKEAELMLAQKDTFGLAVNLKDSIVWLMLKGIHVHGAKIQRFEQDRFFKSLNPLAYVYFFSKPLRTQSESSTIVKEPIVTMKAPKDTIEAINNAFMPDTLIQNPAYFRLDLENGFRLILIQKVFSTAEEKKVERQFKKELSYRKIVDNLLCFMPWKKVSYTPTLILYLNPNEIRSIYRAVPENALVIFTY